MRSIAIGWGRALALTASAITFFCSAAAAGELLVVPYSCSVVDGRPVVTPSNDQGHRVFGPREERDFMACSPVNPEMCRRWKVYRFDVDCGGKRVPWTSVSAAADAHSGGRSWIEAGSLHIEMPPRWSMNPDDPCARRFRVGWRAGPMSRICDERRAAARADVVMPAGFAPMLDLDGIFVPDGAPGDGGGSGAQMSRADTPVPKPTRSEAQPAKVLAEKSAKAPETKKPPATAPAAKPEPVPAPAPAAAPKHEPTPPPAPGPSTVANAGTPPAAGAGTPDMPTIINQPGAPAAKAETEIAAMTPPETTSTPATPKEAPLVVAMKDAVDDPTAKEPSDTSSVMPTSKANDNERQAVEVTILTTLTKSVSPTLLGIGGASMLALLALAFAYRRNQSEPGFTFARDITSVDLDARKGGRELARAGRWLNASARSDAAPPSPAQQQAPAKWGNDIPQSRQEALDVLGMGVAPDVTDMAIKKIVDGLRLSWHPDYAKDAQDRELRELRMKQINAAWEIIVGKRPG